MRTVLLVVLATLACGASSAQAQFGYEPRIPNYGPGYRGNISPYLNILRGQNIGIDYYLGTRSEFQRRENAAQFRSELDYLESRPSVNIFDDSAVERPVQSGTPVSFGNTQGYYNNRQNYLAPTVGRMGGGGGPIAPSRRR